MKKMFILGMTVVFVFTGFLGVAVVAMLTGYGSRNVTEETMAIETEDDENFSSDEAWFVHNLYPAVECILGEEVRYQKVSYVENGFMIDEVFVSYDQIDDHCAHCDEDTCR